VLDVADTFFSRQVPLSREAPERRYLGLCAHGVRLTWQPPPALPRRPNNDHWLHHRAAALNLRRLLALGLHRRDTAWALS
jgi:hypothetical protein